MNYELNKMLAYLRNELPEEEEDNVEEQLDKDETFAWLMERLHQKLFVNGGAEVELKEFEQLLAEKTQVLSKANQTPSTSGTRQLWRPWPYAAIAATLALIAVIFFPREDESLQQIGKRYSIHHPHMIGSKSESSSDRELLYTVLKEYQRSEGEPEFYQEVAALFPEVLEIDDLTTFERQELLLIYGVSLLKSGQIEKAISPLAQILDAGISNQSFAASWYLGLTYLQMDESLEKALPLFQSITNSPNPYQREAEKIVKRIEKEINP